MGNMENMKKIKKILCIILFMLGLLFIGCSKSGPVEPDEPGESDDGDVIEYYMNCDDKEITIYVNHPYTIVLDTNVPNDQINMELSKNGVVDVNGFVINPVQTGTVFVDYSYEELEY